MQIFKSFVFIAILSLATTGCVTHPDTSMATVAAEGGQFGAVSSEVLSSVMNINGCGNTGSPTRTQAPVVSTGAEIRNHDGRVTYDLQANASKTERCE